ncbi:hypothetical protein BAB79_14990 [Mycobacteroides abscessus]|nr:hypothetical protein A3O06_14995 [Mycobacteroides abscessus]ANO24723.1 hypothetical protein BAB79_14990 [Mycobacteroides abscessus]
MLETCGISIQYKSHIGRKKHSAKFKGQLSDINIDIEFANVSGVNHYGLQHARPFTLNLRYALPYCQ